MSLWPVVWPAFDCHAWSGPLEKAENPPQDLEKTLERTGPRWTGALPRPQDPGWQLPGESRAHSLLLAAKQLSLVAVPLPRVPCALTRLLR